MDVTNTVNTLQKIKSSLVFFCVLSFLFGCRNTEEAITPIVEYEDTTAVRVFFKSERALKGFSVYHIKNKDIPILGDFSEKNGYVSFTPALPFSNGQQFGIALNGEPIARFKIASKKGKKVPKLVTICPRRDTVPVNILKMYLEFSEPMQHVDNALDFITVFDKMENTKVYPFLDLEAELWNANRTRLTLWFDPGRIKTNLIPNREKGLPLKKNHSYLITIDKNWKSANGIPLGKPYSKIIHVGGKDTKSPNPDGWTITFPKKKTKSPLIINFNETLDPILALESIKVFTGNIPLSGTMELSNNDNTMLFKPSDFWKVGDYRILIHPVLEDLAGNNLHNLFDSDVRNQKAKNPINTTLEFSIH